MPAKARPYGTRPGLAQHGVRLVAVRQRRRTGFENDANVHDAESLTAGVLALVATGFCGALTTYSTFSFETVRLIEDGAFAAALGNVLLSLGCGLGTGALGWALAQAVL